MDVLSLFFSKRCIWCRKNGSYLCSNCFATLDYSPELICAVCSRPAINGLTHPGCKRTYSIDGVFSAVSYKGVMKKVMYQYKFEPFLSHLSSLLADILYESFIQFEPLSQVKRSDTCVVPIPLSSQKLKQRGYNQALLLSNEFSKRTGFEVKDNLKRVKQTKPQSDLKREERLNNIHDAFILKEKIIFPHVLLLDDILTSGATLNEAAKVLKKSGVKSVFGVTLAHGQ